MATNNIHLLTSRANGSSPLWLSGSADRARARYEQNLLDGRDPDSIAMRVLAGGVAFLEAQAEREAPVLEYNGVLYSAFAGRA